MAVQVGIAFSLLPAVILEPIKQAVPHVVNPVAPDFLASADGEHRKRATAIQVWEKCAISSANLSSVGCYWCLYAILVEMTFQVSYAELSEDEDGSELRPPHPKRRIVRDDEEELGDNLETESDVAGYEFQPDDSPAEDEDPVVTVQAPVPSNIEDLFEEQPAVPCLTEGAPEPWWQTLFDHFETQDDMQLEDCQVPCIYFLNDVRFLGYEIPCNI